MVLGDNLALVLVAELSPDLPLLFVSASARPICGLDPAALLGRRFADCIHPEDAPRLAERLRPLLAAAGQQQREQQQQPGQQQPPPAPPVAFSASEPLPIRIVDGGGGFTWRAFTAAADPAARTLLCFCLNSASAVLQQQQGLADMLSALGEGIRAPLAAISERLALLGSSPAIAGSAAARANVACVEHSRAVLHSLAASAAASSSSAAALLGAGGGDAPSALHPPPPPPPQDAALRPPPHRPVPAATGAGASSSQPPVPFAAAAAAAAGAGPPPAASVGAFDADRLIRDIVQMCRVSFAGGRGAPLHIAVEWGAGGPPPGDIVVRSSDEPSTSLPLPASSDDTAAPLPPVCSCLDPASPPHPSASSRRTGAPSTPRSRTSWATPSGSPTARA